MFYSLKNYPQKTDLKEAAGTYQVRGLENFLDVKNPPIPAKFYSSGYLIQIFQDMFYVTEITFLFDEQHEHLPANKNPRRHPSRILNY